MKKLVTLGPAGTYAEIAAKAFIKNLKEDIKLSYEPSIDFCFEGFRKSDYLVIPLENSIDGYIQRSLDLLLLHQASIIDEVNLPITFSLVSNEVSLDHVDTIYVQFKAKNQCLNFLHQFKNWKYIITDSNAESLALHLKNPTKTAAIVPGHLVKNDFSLVINNLQDEASNQTRFVLIKHQIEKPKKPTFKAMIVMSPNVDKPGLLHNLLGMFASHQINLTSILSRPKRKSPGTYHFFLELKLDSASFESLLSVINEAKGLDIKLLGVY